MSVILKRQIILAKNILAKLGNLKPSRKHIALINLILSSVTTTQDIIFDDRLTPGEISCLYLIALGKNGEEIAHFLNISPATVNTYRKRIKSKLKCSSLAQAVFEGIRCGYIVQKHLENNLSLSSKVGIYDNTDR